MNEPAPRRAYDSSRRQAAALQRRLEALAAARRLFGEKGYAATTMADIAAAAGVNVDTLYAGLGTKAELFALLLETELAETLESIPAERRNYVAAMEMEPEPHRKLEIFATAVSEIWERMAPLLHVLQTGAAADETLAEIWDDFLRQRLENLRLLIDALQPTGAMRGDLDPAEAAETAWALSSTEVYALLTRTRGWTTARYRDWLADAFERLLLSRP